MAAQRRLAQNRKIHINTWVRIPESTLSYLWCWREVQLIQNQVDNVLAIAFKWRVLFPIKYLFTYPHFFPSINILWVSSIIWWKKTLISWLSVFSTFLSLLIVFDYLQTKKANNLFLSRRMFVLQESESIWNELGWSLTRGRGLRWSRMGYQNT